MDQTLIDKFKPEVKNLTEAIFLQKGLELLPDETIDGKVDTWSHPNVTLLPTNVIHLGYSGGMTLPVTFPENARECKVRGSTCTFEYKQIKYQIN
jgi:predicted ThiF/HesA family dinucleotide-utilizing enzyme